MVSRDPRRGQGSRDQGGGWGVLPRPLQRLRGSSSSFPLTLGLRRNQREAKPAARLVRTSCFLGAQLEGTDL